MTISTKRRIVSALLKRYRLAVLVLLVAACSPGAGGLEAVKLGTDCRTAAGKRSGCPAVADALTPFVAARGGTTAVYSGSGENPDGGAALAAASSGAGVALRIDRLRSGYTVEIDGQPYPVTGGTLSAVLSTGNMR